MSPSAFNDTIKEAPLYCSNQSSTKTAVSKNVTSGNVSPQKLTYEELVKTELKKYKVKVTSEEEFY